MCVVQMNPSVSIFHMMMMTMKRVVEYGNSLSHTKKKMRKKYCVYSACKQHAKKDKRGKITEPATAAIAISFRHRQIQIPTFVTRYAIAKSRKVLSENDDDDKNECKRNNLKKPNEKNKYINVHEFGRRKERKR